MLSPDFKGGYSIELYQWTALFQNILNDIFNGTLIIFSTEKSPELSSYVRAIYLKPCQISLI